MVARRVVGAFVVFVGITAAGAGSSAHAAAATQGLWSVTRDGNGQLHVVRGLDAAVAAMDNRLGRDTTQVLTTEQDENVHLLDDQRRAAAPAVGVQRRRLRIGLEGLHRLRVSRSPSSTPACSAPTKTSRGRC